MGRLFLSLQSIWSSSCFPSLACQKHIVLSRPLLVKWKPLCLLYFVRLSQFKIATLGWSARSTIPNRLKYMDMFLNWFYCVWVGNSTVSFISRDESKLFDFTKNAAIFLFSYRTTGNGGWSIWPVFLPLSVRVWSLSLPLSVPMVCCPFFACLLYIVYLPPKG